MSDLGDLIKDAGDTHADALEAQRREAGAARNGAPANPSVDAPISRAVASIRRRRLVRAGATGAVAAIGLLLATTAMAALGPDEQQPVAPTVTGSQPWCDLDSYPQPSMEWRPSTTGYYGRVYADFTTDTYMLRTADGELRQLVQDENGIWVDPENGLFYEYLMWYHPNMLEEDQEVDRLVFDRFIGDSMPEVAPTELWHEWGAPVESAVPDGISGMLLRSVHELVLSGVGSGPSADLGGEDADVERILTYADGSQESTRLLLGQAVPDLVTTPDLVSVTTRVTTASGASAQVTSEYDASLTYEAACGESDSVWADATQPEGDSPDDTVPAWEDPVGYLEGPESVAFSCGSALDEALQREPEWLERREGVVYVEDESQQVDYGEGATVIAPGPTEEDMPGFEWLEGESSPGWMDASSVDLSSGIHVFGTIVWVDTEDRIVGTLDRESLTYRGDPWFTDGFRYEDADDDSGIRYYTLFDEARDHMDLCAGSVDADTSELVPVLLTGLGPSQETLDWAWYRFDA